LNGRETTELLPAASASSGAGKPRGAAGQSRTEAAEGGGAPKVTVNRLDVRVVNQTPTPPAPTPPTPAPAPQRDGWDSMDRGHLGRLFLL
jgi:hypothetical protein